MMVLIVHEERRTPADLATMTDQERAELFRTMVAYGGTYTFDGTTVTHHLDIAWNQVWTGTDLLRTITFTFDGRKAIFTTTPQPRSHDGKVAISVSWEKLE